MLWPKFETICGSCTMRFFVANGPNIAKFRKVASKDTYIGMTVVYEKPSRIIIDSSFPNWAFVCYKLSLSLTR